MFRWRSCSAAAPSSLCFSQLSPSRVQPARTRRSSSRTTTRAGRSPSTFARPPSTPSGTRASGAPELNGTPVWWAARGMASLLADHQVAFDYSLGWGHSIAEVFAEDYAYIHTHSRYGITWLSPPDAALQSAMFAELGTPAEALPAAPEVPLVINRTGTLTPRDSFTVPFGLLGPGRRVTLAATISK